MAFAGLETTVSEFGSNYRLKNDALRQAPKHSNSQKKVVKFDLFEGPIVKITANIKLNMS